MSGMTSAAVALPPRNPYRSARITRTPACAAPSAAPRPAGPPPTTSPSVSPASTAWRGGSSTLGAPSGSFSVGIRESLPRQHLEEDAMRFSCALLQRRQRLRDLRAHRAAPVPGLVQIGDKPAGVHQVERWRRQAERLQEAAHLAGVG